MEVSTREFIGLVAGGLTAIAFLLPVLRAHQGGAADRLPLPTLVLALAAAVLWLVYGILWGSLSIILGGSVMLLLIALVLVVRLRRPSPRSDQPDLP